MTAYVPGLAETDLKKIVLAVQQLASGRSNAVGSVMLVTGSATTTVLAPNCAAGSTPILTPTSANAATEVGNGTPLCQRRCRRIVHHHACELSCHGADVSLRNTWVKAEAGDRITD